MTDPVDEYMMALTGSQFEQEVARYLETQDFTNVHLVGCAGDRGVDITCRDDYGRDVTVQCKAFSKSNTIGSPAIQYFNGALRLHRAERAMYVTTSSFTDPAKKVAYDLDIELVSGATLRPYFAQVLAEELARQEWARREAAGREAERQEEQRAAQNGQALASTAPSQGTAQPQLNVAPSWTAALPAHPWEPRPKDPDVYRWSAGRTIAFWTVVIVVGVVTLGAFIYFESRSDDGFPTNAGQGPEVPSTRTAQASGPPETITVVQANGAPLMAQPSAGARIIATVGAGTRLTVNGPLMNVVDDGGRRQWWWPVLVPDTDQVAYLAISPEQETTSTVQASGLAETIITAQAGRSHDMFSTAQASGPPETIRVTLAWDGTLKARPSEGAPVVATVEAGSRLTLNGPPVEVSLESGSEQTWWPVLVPGTDQEAYIAGHSVIDTE